MTRLLVLIVLALTLFAVPASAAPDRKLVATAEKGDAASQYVLGSLYARGQGVPRDDKKALQWYTRAANKGHMFAETNLGFFYDAGLGMDARDAALAFKWYEKAARQGDALAQANLASLYVRGDGVTQNYAEAYFWFTLASAGGRSRNVATARDSVARRLTPAALATAQARASAWKPQKEK